MAGTRALFASIGASAALVAAAALSLLTLSAVFAFGGWSAPASPFVEQPAVIFDASSSSSRDGEAIALARPERRDVAPASARRSERREASTARPVRPDNAAPARITEGGGRTTFTAPVRPPVITPPAPPAETKSGDQVRKVGDSLSSTVQNAGTALSNATQSLAPPVSAAVQQVLNLVADAVRRAADGLGSTLDTLVPPKR